MISSFEAMRWCAGKVSGLWATRYANGSAKSAITFCDSDADDIVFASSEDEETDKEE